MVVYRQPPPEKRRISQDDLKITTENIISIIRTIDGNILTKDSVIETIKGLYEWFTFDPNRPIPVPRTPGSRVTNMMWPQGAVINTRAKNDAIIDKDDKRHLKELDDVDLRIVAKSVVSSSHGTDMSFVHRGRIHRNYGVRYEDDGYMLPDDDDYDEPVLRGPRDFRSSDNRVREEPGNIRNWRNDVPVTVQDMVDKAARLSILGMPPIQKVAETPDNSVRIDNTQRVVRRPKVATVKRPRAHDEKDEAT